MEPSIQKSFLLYFGPTPIPDVGVELWATVGAELIECCENGNRIHMVEASVSLTGTAIWGAAYTGLVRANHSKTIWRNAKTGKYSKPPTVAHRKGGKSLGIGKGLGKCPKAGIHGEIDLGFNAGVGYGPGVKGGVDFELYPHPHVLSGYVRGAFVIGGYASASLTGTLSIIEPIGTPENLFANLGQLLSPPVSSSAGYSGDSYYGMPVL